MKKLFLTLALALGVAATASAQEANKMWAGGTVGLWSSKVKGADSQLSFKVMPEFGMILSENIGVGISLGAAHTHTGSDVFVNEGSGSSSENIYIVNPFVRYTFLKGDLGALFVDGGVAYNWSKVCNGGHKGTGLDVGFKPGVALNVSDRVSILGKFGFLGYQYDKQESKANFAGEKSETKTNSFGFDFDMRNVEFGISLKF